MNLYSSQLSKKNESTRNASHYFFSVGAEEEILQYGGGHERKDPCILQGASTQFHGN